MENPTTSRWRISDAVKLFADGLTLVYHEARNVRFLIKGDHLEREGWERLLNLPSDRVKAWKDLQFLRKAARGKLTADEVSQVFEKQFGRGLKDLATLYANQNWKHANAYGGHAWCHVTQLVVELGHALGCSDQGLIDTTCGLLLQAKHNNGWLRNKIKELDCEIDVTTDIWW
jgi:hypothetical protein